MYIAKINPGDWNVRSSCVRRWRRLRRGDVWLPFSPCCQHYMDPDKLEKMDVASPAESETIHCQRP